MYKINEVAVVLCVNPSLQQGGLKKSPLTHNLSSRRKKSTFQMFKWGTVTLSGCADTLGNKNSGRDSHINAMV